MKIVRILLIVALVGVVVGLKVYKGNQLSQKSHSYSNNYNNVTYNQRQQELKQLILEIEMQEQRIERMRQEFNEKLNDPYCDSEELEAFKDDFVRELKSYKARIMKLQSKKKGDKELKEECDELIKDAERMIREAESLC